MDDQRMEGTEEGAGESVKAEVEDERM